MLLVRTGGIFGVFVSLIVAAIFFFVVRPAINDTTDRAFDTADRILDNTQPADRRHAGPGREGHGRPTTSTATTWPRRTSPPSCNSIKAELGDDAEILDFTANPMGGNVKYRTGDRAAGFQFGAGFDGLRARQGHARRLGQARRQRLPDRQAARRRRRHADRRGRARRPAPASRSRA